MCVCVCVCVSRPVRPNVYMPELVLVCVCVCVFVFERMSSCYSVQDVIILQTNHSWQSVCKQIDKRER